MRLGLPAVVVVSEQFEHLAKVVLASNDVPGSAAVVVRGNPETFADDELRTVAAVLLGEIVKRLAPVDGR